MMPARESAVRYMPLISMKSADPDRVYTAVVLVTKVDQKLR